MSFEGYETLIAELKDCIAALQSENARHAAENALLRKALEGFLARITAMEQWQADVWHAEVTAARAALARIPEAKPNES